MDGTLEPPEVEGVDREAEGSDGGPAGRAQACRARARQDGAATGCAVLLQLGAFVLGFFEDGDIGFVHDTHAAAAQLCEHAIMGNGFPDHVVQPPAVSFEGP